MTFPCVYCATEHAENLRTAEHIVPRCIGNPHFTHRNACARMNNALARAVERPFHTQSNVEAILRIIDPPKEGTDRFFGVAVNHCGTEVRAIQRGNTLLRCDLYERPLRQDTVDTVNLPFRRRDGSEVHFPLKLPFQILDRVAGSDFRFTERIRERLKRTVSEQADRVVAYVDDVLQDPSRVPEFERFIVENDIEHWTLILTPGFHRENTPVDETKEVFHRDSMTDLEVVLRYFAKIGLLFAAEVGPSSLLVTREADALRAYLAGLFVDQALARRGQDAQFPIFSKALVAGEMAYWWAGPIDVTEVALNTSTSITDQDRDCLSLENHLRLLRLNLIKELVNVTQRGDVPLNSEFHLAPAAYAYHELRIQNQTRPTPGAWCEILLFGGLFRAQVRLSSTPLAEGGALTKRIETPWYRPR